MIGDNHDKDAQGAHRKKRNGRIHECQTFCLVYSREEFNALNGNDQKTQLITNDKEIGCSNSFGVKSQHLITRNRKKQTQSQSELKKQILLPKAGQIVKYNSNSTNRRGNVRASHYHRFFQSGAERDQKQQCIITQRDYEFVSRINSMSSIKFTIDLLEEILIGLEIWHFRMSPNRKWETSKSDLKQVNLIMKQALPFNRVSQTLARFLYSASHPGKNLANNLMKLIFNHWMAKKVRFKCPLVRSLWRRDMQIDLFKDRGMIQTKHMRNRTQKTEAQIGAKVLKDFHAVKEILQKMIERSDLKNKVLIQRSKKVRNQCLQIMGRFRNSQHNSLVRSQGISFCPMNSQSQTVGGLKRGEKMGETDVEDQIGDSINQQRRRSIKNAEKGHKKQQKDQYSVIFEESSSDQKETKTLEMINRKSGPIEPCMNMSLNKVNSQLTICEVKGLPNLMLRGLDEEVNAGQENNDLHQEGCSQCVQKLSRAEVRQRLQDWSNNLKQIGSVPLDSTR